MRPFLITTSFSPILESGCCGQLPRASRRAAALIWPFQPIDFAEEAKKGADNVSQAVDLTIKLLKPNYPGVTRLAILDMYLNEEDDSDDYYEKVIHDDNFRLATMESLVLGRPLSKDIVKVIISSYMKDGNTDVEEIMNLSLKQLKKHYPDLTREKLQYYL